MIQFNILWVFLLRYLFPLSVYQGEFQIIFNDCLISPTRKQQTNIICISDVSSWNTTVWNKVDTICQLFNLSSYRKGISNNFDIQSNVMQFLSKNAKKNDELVWAAWIWMFLSVYRYEVWMFYILWTLC